MTLAADFSSPSLFSRYRGRDRKALCRRSGRAGAFPIVGRVWAPTTQALADQVLKEHETFTIRGDDGTVAGFRWWIPRIVRTLFQHMLSMDDPDHKRLRDIVDEAFRGRAVLGMESHIRAIGDELADQLFAEGDPADLVARFARQLPLSVISELLGLPLADQQRYNSLGRRLHALHRRARFPRCDPKSLCDAALPRNTYRERSPARRGGVDRRDRGPREGWPEDQPR